MKTFSVSLAVALAVLVSLISSANCMAQTSSLPNQSYYGAFGRFFEGDYRDAARDFRNASRSSYKIGNQRYVDSICYWTMEAECYYHMGNYAEAIALYEQALNLYLFHQNNNWQNRIKTNAIKVQADNNAVAQARINWGASKRITGVARVPVGFQVQFGNLNNLAVAAQGGIIQAPEFRLVNVTEVMRCVALSLHRRRYIKGPIAKIDPLTSRIVSSLRGVTSGDGSVMGSYNGVCLGIAYASQEEWAKASQIFRTSLRLSGGLDHPLTPVGLLESSYLGLSNDNDSVASTLALEASYSAAVFDQFDLVAEALTVGTMVHLKTSRSVYPPLRNSIGWARLNDANLMQANSIVRLAECLSEAGELNLSQKALQQSSQVINRRNTLGQSVIGARAKYVTALNQFLATDFAGGLKTLAGAIAHFNTGSLWLYRLKLADQLAVGGATPRQVDQLYKSLLHDPTDLDWKIDPFEAITFLVTPHLASMERWFETAVKRRDMRQAFDIAELTRRHRFFASLPMGGRQMAFRWMLHAPESALSKTALTQRAKFFNSNANYKQSIERAAELEAQLKQIPLNAEPKSEDAIARTKLTNELAKISAVQETILGSMSLRREAAEMVFPPSYSEAQIRNTIRPDQLALVTMATGKGYHFFLLSQKSLQYATFVKTRTMHREISNWLKAIGGNQSSVDAKQITGKEWQKGAKSISQELFAKVLPDQWSRVKELVIVPDGALWYLPFEALMVGPTEKEAILSENVGIRYCPTASLAFGGQRPVKELSNLVVLTGNLSPKTDVELATTEYQQIFGEVPEALEWKSFDISSNIMGAQIDQLLAWTYIRSAKNSPLATAPLSTEKHKLDDGSLNAWMKLPWGAPQHMILPGYQSPGISLRGRTVGSDMFLTTTGMMAAGSRTVLISRWNTAGKTSFDLTGNYAAKLKSDGNLAALAQARKSVRESDLELKNEPRVRASKVTEAIKAEHPFFWASSMFLGIPDDSEPGIQSGKRKRTTPGGSGGGFAQPKVEPKPEPEKPDAGLPKLGQPNVEPKPALPDSGLPKLGQPVQPDVGGQPEVGEPEVGDQPEGDPGEPESVKDVLEGDDGLQGGADE